MQNTMQNFMVMVECLNIARNKEREIKGIAPNGGKWWATIHREQVEALTIAMMPAYTPTHTYNGYQGWEDPSVPHPLKDETCMLMERSGMTKAGFNGMTLQPARAAAMAYCKDGTYGDMDVEQMIAFWKEQDWVVGDYVMLEVNVDDELAAL